jgi:hypothetical protein
MPVTAEHLAAAGFVSSSTALESGQRVLFSKDVVMDSHEVYLRWLSDVFMVPRAGLFTTVFSLGDVLMVIGLFRLIQYGMLYRDENTKALVKG